MTKISGYIDFDEELQSEQYCSLEYIQGKHDGMVEVLGLFMREHAKGRDFETIIDKGFQKLYSGFDKYKDPELLEKEKELFRKNTTN